MSLGELRPQTGLAGLWHFNGNSTDSSGGGFNGTDSNITYSSANGKLGQGAGFNGSTSHIQMGDTNDFTGNFTLKCLVNFAVVNTQQALITKGLTGDPNGWDTYALVLNSSGKIVFTTRSQETSDSPKATVTSNLTLSANVWYDIVATRDGTNNKLYINGNFDNSVAWSSAQPTTTRNFQVGSIRDAGLTTYQCLNGKIDEVAVFNVAKTADWIKKQYSLIRFGEL